ncbi:hypothetical protein KR200_009269, partial [Drosophila serrata]
RIYLEIYYFQTKCSLPKGTDPSAEEYCILAINTFSCRLFVNLINLMKIFFCTLNQSFIPIYGLCNAAILIILFSLLHMVTKYFFFPNLVSLIEFTPTTMLGSAYLISGPCLLMPYYTSAWRTCVVREENSSPLQFAKLTGDIMRYFVIGIMVICAQGYKADGVTWWSCITFMMLGLVYLLVVSNRRLYIQGNDTAKSKDLTLLEFRVIVFIFTFGIVLLVIVVSSFMEFSRSGLKKKRPPESFSDLESDDEILGSYTKQRSYSRRRIWWTTVNGNKIMQDSPLTYRIFMVPIFFVAAHFIPVISKDRIHYGWVKYINCFCFLVLPVLHLFYTFALVDFIVMTIICWVASFLVYISTHSLRRPDHLWLFTLLGLVISSMAMCVLCREIDNLIWQFIGLRFNLLPDLNVLMYFGLGEVFCEAIVVRGLQRRKMLDACFGFVMSLSTYAIFLTFPLLYYHECYNRNCSLIATASSETCVLFILIILFSTLLHISMSGYEFRFSLLLYLMGETFVYVIFQWMRHHGAVFPLTSLPTKK